MADTEASKPAPTPAADAAKAEDKTKVDEMTETELDEIVGGIGGTNGKVSSGTGSATPPPTAPPRTP